ncbi:MAG TPA: MFS transporter [Conexibacter sp.]|nr:MFS transporter [Conexibacter sp.]
MNEHDTPAGRWSPTWTLIAASLALMMSFLDALVVTTALPTLRSSLHGSLAELEWTVNAYNLAFACLLLTGAALGDRFGRRRMLGIGLVTFMGASLMAGAAKTIGVLIAARALQGTGAAMMVPLTLTLVTDAFPPERRGWAIGIWGGIGGLSGAIGPFVGGGVVQAIGWHWIFWINLPVGLAVLLIAHFRVRQSYGGHPRLDIAGVLLATAGLFCIVWAIVRTNTLGWGSFEVVAMLIAGLAILASFLLWERRTPHPMLPLTMFRSASFNAGNAISFCLFAGLFGGLFLMSQFFQTAQGLSPLEAGAELLAWSASGMVVMPLVGRLTARYGNRPFMIAGLLMMTGGLAGVAILARQGTAFLELAPLLTISGSGTAMVFPAVANEVMGSVAPEQIGIASGTNNALRELGGVFGVAVLASVFNRPGVYTSPDSFVSGFRTALWVAVAFSAVAIPLALSLKRGTQSPGPDPSPTPVPAPAGAEA